MNAEQKKRMDDMLAAQEKEFKNLAKELKLGDDIEEADPELRELHRQMKKQGRTHTFNALVE